MLDKRIKFDERYDSQEYGTVTLYFIAPKEMLNGKYPEAESMEISVEFPKEHIEAAYASVKFSPTKDGEDYDWYDADLPYKEIEELILLGRQEFYGKWENKGIIFEMFRRWGDGIKDHLEMECYPAGKESKRKIFAKTTQYIEPMDFLLYCQYNYEYKNI